MATKRVIRKYLPELKAIAAKNHGVLRGEDIVSYARNPKTILHGWFEWDNTAAAHQYRLEQARSLVRVSVEILPRTEVEYRAFVSLVGDQQKDGGGYRITTEVLSDADMRDAYLQQAFDEMERFQAKYAHIKELSAVFVAFNKVKSRRKKSKAA